MPITLLPLATLVIGSILIICLFVILALDTRNFNRIDKELTIKPLSFTVPPPVRPKSAYERIRELQEEIVKLESFIKEQGDWNLYKMLHKD